MNRLVLVNVCSRTHSSQGSPHVAWALGVALFLLALAGLGASRGGIGRGPMGARETSSSIPVWPGVDEGAKRGWRVVLTS